MSSRPIPADAFEGIVREHQAMVFRTLHRLTGPGAHLEDLAQDVFLRLFRALPEFRGEALLSTWLYRIVVNVAQDEWKRRRRDRDHLTPPPSRLEEDEAETWLETLPGAPFSGEHTHSPEQLLHARELRDAVESALLDLSGPERAVLVLFHQEELSYEGIAAALGMPVNTVRTHLHRGRKRLATFVQQRFSARPRPTEYAGKGRTP